MILTLSMLIGCDPSEPEVTPPAPAAEPIPAPDPKPPVSGIAERVEVAVEQQNSNTHCGSGAVFFSCPVAGEKVLSVCGTIGTAASIAYHFGPLGSPELSFPEEAAGSTAKFAHEALTAAMSQGNQVAFENDGYRYEIIEMQGAGGVHGEANNFSGVMITRSGESVVAISCAGSVVSDWEKLVGVL